MKRYGIFPLVMIGVLAAARPVPSQAQSVCPPNFELAGPLAGRLTDCFNELVRRIAELEGQEKATGDRLPIGTVLASHLPPPQFAASIGEREGDSLDKRTWIFSDGRQVDGTKFAMVTGASRVPDLQGVFLRGISPEGPRRAGDFQNYATALPTKNFVGETSAEGAMTLPRSANPSRVDKYNAGGKNYPVITSGETQTVEPHSHTAAIIGGGDEETRPKNVAVFHYIKIN